MNTTTEQMLGEVLEPVFRSFPPEAMRQLVELEGNERLQQRVEEYARKANEGTLTAEEQRAYTSLIDAGDILATLQALARRALNETPA